MSCSPHDLRDYILDELKHEERLEVDRHLKTCSGCRLEAGRLTATRAALASLREEEIPQRIAFVSDKIFEPSLLHRWWRAAWVPAGALVAAAVVFAALYRPAPVVVRSAFEPAQLRAEISTEVAKAVAASEERQARRSAELVAAAERRFELNRQTDRVAMDEALQYMKKRLNVTYMASADSGATR